MADEAKTIQDAVKTGALNIARGNESRDGIKGAGQRSQWQAGNMRYPRTLGAGGEPSVLFTTHRAMYNNVGNDVSIVPTGNSVALYIPTNTSIADSLRYEGVQTGVVGAAMEKGVTNFTSDDLEAIAFQNAEALGGIAGGVLGSNAGTVAAVVTGGGVAGIVGNVKNEFSKNRQRVMNPREFMLFKSPTLRQFAFNFTFVPSNEAEAMDVPEIIKFFRMAAYPSLHTGGIDYVFPDAFRIQFLESKHMIKIPEVVCISVNVTYNPNSISYFRVDNLPVDIQLQLQFQELMPMDQGLVERGY